MMFDKMLPKYKYKVIDALFKKLCKALQKKKKFSYFLSMFIRIFKIDYTLTNVIL